MSAQHKAGTDTYTINELCRKLGMSRPQVFELISMNVFRSIHVKGCTRISKPSFDEWITYCDVSKKKSSKLKFREGSWFNFFLAIYFISNINSNFICIPF